MTTTPARSVLVAEDDPHIRRVIEITLKRHGFDVTAVPDGADALVKLETRLYDVVLLDGMMITMDGIEVCRRLKADPRTADIPIVMLTARTSRVEESAVREAGAAGYMRKPFDAPALIAELQRVCGERG
jgi:two-component system phosphate regulon response regulator PhoB